MTPYLLIFIAGAAGSFHCLGMCGGFACALGPDSRSAAATLRRHLIYNTGRVTTYVFLGALAGALSTALLGQPGGGDPIGMAQRGLALVSGLLMVFIGLQFFGFFQRVHGTALGIGGQMAVQSIQSLLKVPGPGAPLALGVLNGFLPCPLVYAFLAHATALSLSDPSRGVATGVFTMAAFGLGTFPAMLLMGWLGGVLRPVWRRRGVWVAGAFILALGLATIARGAMSLGGDLIHVAQAEQGKSATVPESQSGVGGPLKPADRSGRLGARRWPRAPLTRLEGTR